MKHFISTKSWSKSELQEILDFSIKLKENPFQPILKNKSIAMIFFNPSLRTKTSFEIGINELSGTAVVIQPGKDAWPMEFAENVVMDGESEEHVKEVAQVLSSYCDCIAVRAFPKFESWEIDRTNHVIESFAKYASVPIINGLTDYNHPCQIVADIFTIIEKKGELNNIKNFKTIIKISFFLYSFLNVKFGNYLVYFMLLESRFCSIKENIMCYFFFCFHCLFIY